MTPIIIIPARLGSTRLARKPLADIHGLPMVVHVWRRAMQAKIGPVVVACCGSEIGDLIESHGGKAVITDPLLPSGSDRVYAALKHLEDVEGAKHDVVINLQGDIPMIDPKLIVQSLTPLANPSVDIGTLAARIHLANQVNNPNVVKIAMSEPMDAGVPCDSFTGRAAYFSRLPIPANANHHYHHIGIYAYRRGALEKFVKAPMSYLEKCERLEQLRAIELGMRIDVTVVDRVPISVDTAQDMEMVRKLIATQESLGNAL